MGQDLQSERPLRAARERLLQPGPAALALPALLDALGRGAVLSCLAFDPSARAALRRRAPAARARRDRKSTRLNSSHVAISYAVFCFKKKKSHEGCSEM